MFSVNHSTQLFRWIPIWNIQVIEINLLCREKMSLMRQTMFYLIVQERAIEVFTPFLIKGFTFSTQSPV